MSEGSFKSYDPLSYYVNNISDLDPKLVVAYKEKNEKKINEILNQTSESAISADVFICINKSYHAFLLLAPFDKTPVIGPVMVTEDPFDLHDLTLVWRIELRYEEMYLRTYKITKNLAFMKDAKKSIYKSFHIGRYENIWSLKCLDMAILHASPHHYNAILNDCVEFAKEFCISLLSYCSNGSALEKDVLARIKRASATGLSIEHFSRNSALSGFLGNVSLAGIDASSFFGGLRQAWLIILLILFVLVYPVIVAVAVCYFMGRTI